ncbi:MAG: metalloregulator ArsR/SmtB family transcription factor [Bacillota bacterium]
MEDFVKLCKALGEPTRLKILRLLAVRPMYVCELNVVLDMSQPRISQHLRVLKEAGLLGETREAQRIFYSLDLEGLKKRLGDLMRFFIVDMDQLPGFSDELSRLAGLESDGEIKQCKAGMKPLHLDEE